MKTVRQMPSMPADLSHLSEEERQDISAIQKLAAFGRTIEQALKDQPDAPKCPRCGCRMFDCGLTSFPLSCACGNYETRPK